MGTPSPRWKAALGAAAVLPPLLFSPAPARARQDPVGGSKPATFRADTALVLLDLVVRDRKGQPVTDLRPEEIQVYEDGVRREVSGAPPRARGRPRNRSRKGHVRGAGTPTAEELGRSPREPRQRVAHLIEIPVSDPGDPLRRFETALAEARLVEPNRPDKYEDMLPDRAPRPKDRGGKETGTLGQTLP